MLILFTNQLLILIASVLFAKTNCWFLVLKLKILCFSNLFPCALSLIVCLPVYLLCLLAYQRINTKCTNRVTVALN